MCHFGIAHLILVAHIVLLLLIARENADFLDICIEKAAQNGIAERAGASCYQEGFVFED